VRRQGVRPPRHREVRQGCGEGPGRGARGRRPRGRAGQGGRVDEPARGRRGQAGRRREARPDGLQHPRVGLPALLDARGERDAWAAPAVLEHRPAAAGDGGDARCGRGARPDRAHLRPRVRGRLGPRGARQGRGPREGGWGRAVPAREHLRQDRGPPDGHVHRRLQPRPVDGEVRGGRRGDRPVGARPALRRCRGRQGKGGTGVDRGPRRRRPLRRGSADPREARAPGPLVLRDARAHRRVEPRLLRHKGPAGTYEPLRHDGCHRGVLERSLRLGGPQGAPRLLHGGGHGRGAHHADPQGHKRHPRPVRGRPPLPRGPRDLGPLQLRPARDLVRGAQRRRGGEPAPRPPLPRGFLFPGGRRLRAPPRRARRLHLRPPHPLGRPLPDARDARGLRALRRREQRGPHAPVDLRVAPRLRPHGGSRRGDTLPLRLQPHTRHPGRPRRGAEDRLQAPRRGLRRLRLRRWRGGEV
ncbi:MAG: L-fucose isomerase, partial [uncultured Rubrobacteraceae bacterium]